MRGLINSPGLFTPSPAISRTDTLAFERSERPRLLASAHSHKDVVQQYNNRYHQQDMDQTASDMPDEPTE